MYIYIYIYIYIYTHTHISSIQVLLRKFLETESQASTCSYINAHFHTHSNTAGRGVHCRGDSWLQRKFNSNSRRYRMTSVTSLLKVVLIVVKQYGCVRVPGMHLPVTVTVWDRDTVTVTDNLLNARILSPVSRQLSQPIQSPREIIFFITLKNKVCHL